MQRTWRRPCAGAPLLQLFSMLALLCPLALLLCPLLLLLCPLPAQAAQTTLIADAHVNAALPTTNSGAISNLDVGGGYTALLQFDLSMLPQGTTPAQVSRAVLRLYANRVTTSGTVSLAPVTGAWGEYSVTFATEPSMGSAAGSFLVSQASAYVAVDVTSLVQGWIMSPATNNGLALSAAAAVVQFDSRENDETAHAATLEIELADAGPVGLTGAPGAIGPAGPQGYTGAQGLAGAVGLAGPAGSAGVKGANGATGVTGSQGIQGPQGLAGPAGPAGSGSSGGFVYQGAYSPGQNYPLGAVVVWQGSSYTSLVVSNQGNTPSLSPLQWGVLTAQGPAGATGATGALGPLGPQGLSGSVGPNGPVGPLGLQGIPGQAGAQGISGATGAIGLSGPMGPAGVPGPVGLSFQGVYSPTGNYGLANGVSYNGTGYVSLVANNHGNTPDQSSQQWALFAAAGTSGSVGPAGTTGATGPAGQQGSQGISGAVGANGATGPQGPSVVNYLGDYQALANYALHDAVSWQGSTYVSLSDGNRGNPPSLSTAQWAVLAAQGPAGATGSAGPTGNPGPAGASGADGAPGPQGPPVAFQGGWLIGTGYATGDTVSYAGSAYIALTGNTNTGRQPDISPVYWGLLTAAGAAGPAGAPGATGLQGPAGYSGSAGATGPQGPTGATGSIGPAGATGPAGPAGPIGPTGATGLTGMVFRGPYTPATNYAMNDAVSYQGAAYLSLTASNTGNTPDQSPSFWTVLAAAGAAGSAGAQGASGAQGLAGSPGATGAAGLAGPAGVAGPTGLSYRASWSNQTRYAVNDAVTYGGSTYIAQSANTSAEPDLYPQTWALLAQSGSLGPSGPAGTAGPAATLSVGSITTGAAGSQANVTNSGTSSAAVLNFTIPQGAAGTGGSGGGGGGGTSGVPFASVFHLVQNNIPGYPYYSVNNSNGSATELVPRSVLTWLPSGCTATSLQVHSEQGGTITVTLRTGATSASMANSPDLVCSALTANNSCTATGSDIIPAGGFVDLVISGANNSSGGVWTALTCN